MNTYTFRVMLEVEVEAFDESDAIEAVKDAFDEGECGGVDIKESEILDIEQRT